MFSLTALGAIKFLVSFNLMLFPILFLDLNARGVIIITIQLANSDSYRLHEHEFGGFSLMISTYVLDITSSSELTGCAFAHIYVHEGVWLFKYLRH